MQKNIVFAISILQKCVLLWRIQANYCFQFLQNNS